MSNSELDLQKLMDIAKNPIKEDEFKKFPPVKRFTLSDGVEAGDYKIPAALIYDRYETWCKSYKVKPVPLKQFCQELAKYYDKVRTSEGIVYLMSPKGFNLSPEHIAFTKDKVRVGKRKSRGKTTKKDKVKEERQD